MTPEQIGKALNDLYNAERYSDAMYTAMAIDFCHGGYYGFEHWCLCQAAEERCHSWKLYDHMKSIEVRPLVLPLKQPPTGYQSPQDAISGAIKHEMQGQNSFKELVSEARKSSDYATESLLIHFVKDYNAELKTLRTLLKHITMSSDLLYIDKELSKRSYPHTVH